MYRWILLLFIIFDVPKFLSPFAQVQIGHTDFKRKALESLIQLLSEDPKNAVLMAREGDMACLVHILDCNNVLKELAVEAISVLAQTDGWRHRLVVEGALGPLVRTFETGGAACKEKAALAVEWLTRDGENAWAIATYGGVSVLIEVCRSGSATISAPTAGALRNVGSIFQFQIVSFKRKKCIFSVIFRVNQTVPTHFGNHFEDMYLPELQYIPKLTISNIPYSLHQMGP